MLFFLSHVQADELDCLMALGKGQVLPHIFLERHHIQTKITDFTTCQGRKCTQLNACLIVSERKSTSDCFHRLVGVRVGANEHQINE